VIQHLKHRHDVSVATRRVLFFTEGTSSDGLSAVSHGEFRSLRLLLQTLFLRIKMVRTVIFKEQVEL
jgi:hypothetical protein